MQVTINDSDLVTVIRVRQDRPYSAILETVIENMSSMFFEVPGDEHWATQETEEGLFMERQLTGPFRVGHAQRFANLMEREFARIYQIWHAKHVPDAPAAPALTFEYQGEPVRDAAVLNKLIEALPDVAYEVGDFDLSQECLRVTDPCYGATNFGGAGMLGSAGVLTAAPGRWSAKTVIGPTPWHFRVKVLQISHESLGDHVPVFAPDTLMRSDITVDVDSAQCGFFDDALYPRDSAQLEYEPGTFYSGCCEATLDNALAGGGVVNVKPGDAAEPKMGAVASTGMGDGSYNVYVKHNEAGKVVLAQLVFLDDPANQEPDDGEEDA